MFSKKKDAAKISDYTPVFHVRYIGSTETPAASGKGCSYAPVQRLWDNSLPERLLKKVAVHINTKGIVMRPADLADQKQRQPSETLLQRPPSLGDEQPQQQQAVPAESLSREFEIADISFCNTDRAVNERIFSWICRKSQDGRLDCHAVLCSTRQKAQTMAIVLSRAFHIAYKDWRTNNRHYWSAAMAQGASSCSSPTRSNTSHNSSNNHHTTTTTRKASTTSSQSWPTSTPPHLQPNGSPSSLTPPHAADTPASTPTEEEDTKPSRLPTSPQRGRLAAASKSLSRQGCVATTSSSRRLSSPSPSRYRGAVSPGFAGRSGSCSSILDPDLAAEIGDMEDLADDLNLEGDRD